MRSFAAFIAVCLTTLQLSAQSGTTLSGIVVDSARNQPISGASVFLNGTLKGTVSGPDGRFTIDNIHRGTYQLIVTCIGYEMLATNIRGDFLPTRMTVVLRHQPTELQAAIVEPYLKDGWERYGRLFMENFIGTVHNAAKCHLRNRSALRFYLSPKTNRLSVIALEPLIIDNDALGYTLEFRLVRFLYDSSNQVMSYSGYPLFHQMRTNRISRRLKWVDNRQAAYYGSKMHFMRTIGGGDSALARSGFTIERTIQETNQLRCRVQEIYHPESGLRDIPRDSLKYYRAILRQPAIVNRIVRVAVVDIVSVDSGDMSTLFFAGRLDVIYRPFHRESFLHLVTPRPIRFDENGAYAPLLEMITEGYWVGSEKIADLLPWDYHPDSPFNLSD